MNFPHNPEHACGTCADCGGEMVWNVPRMGPAGGFVHKESGNFDCKRVESFSHEADYYDALSSKMKYWTKILSQPK